jgi:hypothetical protein
MPSRLGWLASRVSASTIASTIGVSTSRVRFALAGLQALPKAVETQLLNFYRREAYSYLRTIGLPKAQANRFKKGLPETIEAIASELEAHVMGKAKGDDELAERIREGTRRSKKTEEEIVGT